MKFLIAICLLALGVVLGATLPRADSVEGMRHMTVTTHCTLDPEDLGKGVSCPDCPMLGDSFAQDEEARIQRVILAMEAVAATEQPYDLYVLLDYLDQDYTAYDLARIIQYHADENDVDPLVLTAIAWKESRFRIKNFGDYRRGKPISCGWTQIRTDYKGRPTCKSLMDPFVAMGWTAKHIAKFPKWCKGKMCLRKYNGGDYEVKIWRTADQMRRAIL